MKKELYDVIEDLDGLPLELFYQFKANKAFLDSVLQNDRERLNTIDGMEYTQKGLLNHFEKISNELTELMKCK
jgi:hypothetical protein